MNKLYREFVNISIDLKHKKISMYSALMTNIRGNADILK